MSEPATDDVVPADSSRVSSDSDRDLFADVLAVLCLSQLPQVGKAVRDGQRHHHSPGQVKHEPSSLPTVGEPVFGSYNVLFPLTFEDSVKWMIKVPINGTVDKWDSLSAAALTTEAQSMRFLKIHTSIPLPEFYDFSATTQNPLRCPYMIMSYIEGRPLYDIWFRHYTSEVDAETSRKQRERALEDIASAMLQLGRFSFDMGGRPLFDEDGEISGIDSTREVDHKSELERQFINEDDSDDPIYIESGPFKSTQDYYTLFLDLHEETNPVPRGLDKLLRIFISWIPEPPHVKPFVLAHPDFDIQNFIVSDDGHLEGIIDWEGIAAVPRSAGNKRYPGWLTRDWDPAMYSYNESMASGVEPVGIWEDSREELSRMRAKYRQFITQKKEELQGRGRNDPRPESDPDALPCLLPCQVSLIAENLAIAARQPQCRMPILEKLVNEIHKVLDLDPAEEADCMDMASVLGDDDDDGELGPITLDNLEKGFRKLLNQKAL